MSENEDRLLTKEELLELWDKGKTGENFGEFAGRVAEAQLAKDLKAEQARVERVFREIRKMLCIPASELRFPETWLLVSKDALKALRKREGVE